MNGIHDVGGMDGFGSVDHDEEVFHAEWETRVFGMMSTYIFGAGVANVDTFRHAIERMEPSAYLTNGYYGRWLAALETLLVEAEVMPQAEIISRFEALGGETAQYFAARPGKSDFPAGAYIPAGTAYRPLNTEPLFKPGDTVRTRNINPVGHTRLPAYARGKTGRIKIYQEGWVFPDDHAHNRGENPQHVYAVTFSGESLWGPDAEPSTSVTLDLFESYLDPVA
ncbi:MAG: nitrile hydratase subunit beta [Pseudomonadota bacterium]